MSWILEILKDFIGELIIALGGFLAWFTERKRATTAHAILKEELEKDKNSNDVTVMKMYQDALKDMKAWNDTRFDEVNKELDNLRKKLAASQNNYQKLKKEFLDYKLNS